MEEATGFKDGSNCLSLRVILQSGLCRGLWTIAFIANEPCGIPTTSNPSDVVVTKINYLHFAALNYVFTTLVIIAISLCTPAPPVDSYMGMTYFTRNSACLVREGNPNEVSDTDPYGTWTGRCSPRRQTGR